MALRNSRAIRLFPFRVAGAISLVTLVVGMTGCDGTSFSRPSPQSGTAFQGNVEGGQQPVSGASIVLYAAGSVGAGTGAINLLAPNVVTTNASGFFSITGDYVCPTATTQVYVVARGGNPGLPVGQRNPALALMAALGNCGDLTSSTNIAVNEVTTAAAAWSLSQFMGPGAIVGSTATNAIGMQNAFAVTKNLVDPSTGFAPGSALPNGAVIESAKLYTLADALASCVNSDGGSSCTPLFAGATTLAGAPGNTLDAALNIVRNPANNVATIFSAAGSHGPFQPILVGSPNDWTMSITYGKCVSGCGGLNLPGSLAIDSSGNVLIANYFGGVISKFSATGVPASATGIPGAGLRQSYGITVDGSDNVWVTNEQSVTGANNSHFGSVSEFTSTGMEISGYGYTGGGVYFPLAVAADSTGVVWIADYGSSSATLLGPGGTAVSGGNGYGYSALPFTSAVAIGVGHNAWFAVQGGAVQVTPAGAISSFPCCNDPAGIAVDPSGNIWIADYNSSSVIELTSAGSVAHQVLLSGGNAGPQGIAIDGAGNVWVANYYGNSLAQLTGSTAAIVSPSPGYGLDSALDEPYGLAIDASGNLWLSNAGSNTLTQFVGLASPIKTPLLGPPTRP
jgi:streptogramin lyase